MSTVGSDSRSGSSDDGTLESIPHKESSATKPRPDPGRGVDKSDPTERVITENESEAPHAKRQRVTRHHGHNPLMYNARYHPADDFLRPANAAKLKGKSRTHHPVQDGDTTEESASNTEDGGNEGDFHGSQETDLDVVNSDGTALRSASPQVPNLECRRSSRTISRSEAPNYDMRFHPSYDAALRPSLAKAALKRKTSESGFRIVPTEIDNTSACLRDENEVQRSDSSMTAKPHAKAVSKLSYSPLQHIAIPPMVENHPNGSQTREEMKASKPSLVSHAKNSKNSPLSSQLSLEPPLKTPTKSSREASFRTSKRFSRRSPVGPISDEVEDTISSFLNNLPPLRPTSTLAFLHVPWHETALDFHELSPLEQRLYTLQKGAPLNGSTLPETWPQVQRILLDEGEFNWEEFRSKGGLNWIMELYEHVRIGIEAFWRSTPEPANNRDWTLLYAEGFDVFDTKPGSKYWKHYRHSIVQPTSSKIELSQFFEVANSENEGQRESLAPTVPRIDESDPKDLVSPNTDYGMPDIAHGSEVLEDPYEDNEFNDTDLDQTLVDIMGESAPASGPVIGSQELRDLLSPVEQFLATDQGRPNAWTNDPSSALPEVQGEGPSSLAILPKRSLRAPVSSAKTLVASANTVNEQDGSTKVQRAKKRKDRASNGIVVHEDSPSRAPTTDNHVSPGTDVPKENFEVEELVNLGDNHTGTSSNSRRRVASGTPTAPRFIHLGNMSMNSP